MKKKFEKVRIPGSGFEIKLNGGQIRAQNAKLCLKTYFYNLFKKIFGTNESNDYLFGWEMDLYMWVEHKIVA